MNGDAAKKEGASTRPMGFIRPGTVVVLTQSHQTRKLVGALKERDSKTVDWLSPEHLLLVAPLLAAVRPSCSACCKKPSGWKFQFYIAMGDR